MIIYRLIFLRVASSNLRSAICFFIDNALRIGIFSHSCKISKVIPLFRSGKTENLTNYSPIPILTCFFENLRKVNLQATINFFSKAFCTG